MDDAADPNAGPNADHAADPNQIEPPGAGGACFLNVFFKGVPDHLALGPSVSAGG